MEKETLKSNKLRQVYLLPEVTKCGTFLTPALQTKLPIMYYYSCYCLYSNSLPKVTQYASHGKNIKAICLIHVT